jgi:hypothetical protein
MFASAAWVLPRVPCIGEEIYAMNHRIRIDGVRWDDRGRVIDRLQEAPADQSTLATLEAEGWTVAPWEDEPPSEWLEPRS